MAKRRRTRIVTKRGRVLNGKFKERILKPKAFFDRRSFRLKSSGASHLLVGCPVGQYQPKKKRCKVGLRTHAILTPVK